MSMHTGWRRRGPALAWAALVLAGCLSGVSAQAGVPNHAALTVSPSAGPPTTKSAARGTGFAAGEDVELTFDDIHLAVARASGLGSFSKKVKVPAGATPGHHQVRAHGRTSGRMAQASFTVRTDWSTFRFSVEHSGENPYENLLDPTTVDGLVPAWLSELEDGVNSSPTVVEGTVYVGSAYGKFYAVDRTTGEVRWRAVLGGSGAFPSPTVSDGMVYEPASGVLWALDASDGTVIWTKSLEGHASSSPVIADGVLYVGGSQVFAVDPATGTELWATDVGSDVFSSPAVADGLVFASSLYDLTVDALDAETGTPAWSTFVGNYVHSSPAVADGVLYVGADDEGLMPGRLWALDADTGDPLWTANTGGGVFSSPAVADGRVFVGSEDGRVFGFDAQTGQKLWTVYTGDVVASSPAVANGVVYVGSMDHTLYALDAETGEVLWSYETGAGIMSSPAVSDGAVYVGSFDSNLYAFHLATP